MGMVEIIIGNGRDTHSKTASSNHDHIQRQLSLEIDALQRFFADLVPKYDSDRATVDGQVKPGVRLTPSPHTEKQRAVTQLYNVPPPVFRQIKNNVPARLLATRR